MNDRRPDDMKIQMAQHFAAMESEYRNAGWGNIVYEDSNVVLVEDRKGYEFSEWQDEFAPLNFSEMMHNLAGQLVDRRWPVTYPIVFDKLE